jgi:hypothetical protein
MLRGRVLATPGPRHTENQLSELHKRMLINLGVRGFFPKLRVSIHCISLISSGGNYLDVGWGGGGSDTAHRFARF